METQESPFKAGLNSGLIIGIISVVITFIIYFVDASSMVSMYFGLGVLVIFIGLVIYFGIQYRNSIGGFMSFGTAFNFAFTTMVISGIISVIGNLILYTVVDPALPNVLVDALLENQLAMMDKFGAGNTLSSSQIDEMRLSFQNSYTPLGQIKGFGFLLILYAIVALIVGLIIKKRDKSLDY